MFAISNSTIFDDDSVTNSINLRAKFDQADRIHQLLMPEHKHMDQRLGSVSRLDPWHKCGELESRFFLI